MQLTKGAIGNLINRYRAVLKKCHLMNVFGSLAVAGMLVMGGAAAAGAADDLALEGQGNYDSAEHPQVNNLMGGWLYQGVASAEDREPVNGDISLTVEGGTISEIIGGSYVRGENAAIDKVTLGDISTTISGEATSSQFVVGGSKIANDANAALTTGKTTLTIENGIFGSAETTGYELVMGGNYVKTGTDTSNTATTKGSSVVVNDGTFHASVVGGSVAHNYSSTGKSNVADNGDTSVTITGGTFSPSNSATGVTGGINLKAAIIGGGLAYGPNTTTVLGSKDATVTSSVTISGESTVTSGKVVAGSVVANGGYAAIVHGDTLLSMDGGTVNDDLVGGGMVQDAGELSTEEGQPDHNLIVTGDAAVTVAGGAATGEIVGGNYVRGDGSARVANSLVTITGGTFAAADVTQNKAQYVIGGNKSMAYAGDTATTLVEGNSGVFVNGDVTITDGAVVGGSMAKAQGTGQATATVEGNSGVQVDKGELAGVVGGGLAETYYSDEDGFASSQVGGFDVAGTSFVAINGGSINGIAYGAVEANAGTSSAAVVGGGMANGAGASATVDNTNVSITGGTIDGKVVAGGLATNGGTTTVGESTLLTMTGGDVSGDLVGGNLLEKDGKEGSLITSTTVNVEGGTVAGEIYGGSYVRNTTATSAVENATVNISGGTIGATEPQGWAQYVVAGGKAMSNATEAESKVLENATVNISGGDITRGAVVGGGFARAQGSSGSATAEVANSVVNLTGGSLTGVVGGGLAENLGSSATATANVTTASLTISGDVTVNGIIYKANDAERPSAAAVIGGGLAYSKNGQEATASVETANTIVINGGTINGDVYAGGMADGKNASATVWTTNLIIKDGTFNGNIYAGGLSLNDGTVTSHGPSAVIFDGYDGFKGTVDGTLSIPDGAGDTPPTSTLVFKNYNSTFEGIATKFDKLNVSDGSTLELATLSTGTVVEGSTGIFNDGALTLASAGNVKAAAVDVVANNGLSVEGGTLTVTDSLKSSEDGDGTKGINVSGNGVLSAANDLLVKNDESITLADGLSKLYLENGGTLAVTGLGSISTADMQTYHSVLVTENSTGLIKYEGAAIEVSEDDKTASGNLRGSVAESTGALLDGATVEYDAATANTTTVNGGYGADAIVITNAADGDHTVTVQNDLTLTGDGSGTLINVENQNAELTTITVRDGKTLNLGNAAAEINNGTLEATVELGDNSTLNAAAGDYAVEKVTAGQDGQGTVNATAGVNLEMGTIGEEGKAVAAVTADGGNLAAGDIYADNVSVNNGGNLVANSITSDGNLTVGSSNDATGGSTLSAGSLSLNGMLIIDPAWGLASSNAAVASFPSLNPDEQKVVVSAPVGVGQNSYLALGTANTRWLPGVVAGYTNGTGLSQTGITAAMGIYKGITIAAGKALLVDGSKTGDADGQPPYDAGSLEEYLANPDNANTANFAANSLLVINGADAGIAAGNAAIDFETAGTLTVADGAKLLITDAVVGQNYTIVGNVDNAPVVDGWKNNVLESTTDMISLGDATHDNVNNTVTTTAQRNDAHTVFPNLSGELADAVNDLYTGHDGAAGAPRWDYADVNSADMGVRFLSRATDNRFLGADKQAAASTIESAARMAFAGAVPQMTRMASDAATNAVVNRLGFANPVDGAQAMNAEGKIVDRRTTGFALWIAPLWQNMRGWGMEAGDLDYGFNGNLGGVSLGADYTFENAIRAGITFNIGGGYAESSGGDLNSTENRMTFWGLGAYAGWNYQNFGLMADVSYTSTWNDLSQDMDGRMGMGDLEADVQATAISAGLRAEYKLETSALDIIPHIGVRYMSLNTWGYDVDTHGGTVLEGDGFHQDIWTFPIGVTFSKEITMDSGWFFKPSVDFSVIPAAGDIKAKEDVRFTGLPGSYEVETQMMDYLTWQGGVGIQLGNDNLSFGVNYTLQAGQNTTGHGVFGNFRYEF